MNNVRAVTALNARELAAGLSDSASWHAPFAGCAYVCVRGLARGLSEGDIAIVFSQWGEIEDDGVYLLRDQETGASRGIAWVRYVDARSCVCACDNMTGMTLAGRTIRVEHAPDFVPPEKMKERRRDAAPRDAPARRRPDDDAHTHAHTHTRTYPRADADDRSPKRARTYDTDRQGPAPSASVSESEPRRRA